MKKYNLITRWIHIKIAVVCISTGTLPFIFGNQAKTIHM